MMKLRSRFASYLALMAIVASLLAPLTAWDAVAQDGLSAAGTPVVEPASEDQSTPSPEEKTPEPESKAQPETNTASRIAPMAAVSGLPQVTIQSQSCPEGRASVTYQIAYNSNFTAPTTILGSGPFVPTYVDYVGTFTVAGNEQFMVSTSWIPNSDPPAHGPSGLAGVNWNGGEGEDYFFIRLNAPNTACPAGDVTLSKTRIAYTESGYTIAGTGSVKAGDLVAYRISVTPSGTSAVFGLKYGDVAPTGSSLVTSVPEGAAQSCFAIAGGMSCETSEFQYLETGESLSFVQIVRVNNPAPQAVCDSGLINTAYLSTLNGEALEAPRSSNSVSIDVLCPKLSMTKTVNGAASATVAPGSSSTTLTFKIVITNTGDLPTSGSITMVDTLPSDFKSITWSLLKSYDGCLFNHVTGVLRCETTTPLAVGSSLTVELTGTITATNPTCGSHINTATLTAAGSADQVGLHASATANITCAPQVSISKTDPPLTIAGNSLTWNIVLWNTGNGPGTVTLVDNLPSGFAATSVSADPSFNCQITQASTKVTCTPVVPNGTTAQTGVKIGINITIDPAAECKVTENTASISGTGVVVASDSSTVGVLCSFGLGFGKTDGLGSDDVPVAPGTAFEFTISYQNTGPSVARNVVITDPVPAEFDIVGTLPAGCAAVENLVTCTMSTVPVTDSPNSIRIPVRLRTDLSPTACEDGVTNTAKITAPVGSTNMTLDASAFIQPDCRIDASVTKVAGTVVFGDDGVAQPGETGSYTISVTNSGTLDITNMVVTDTPGSGEIQFGDATGNWGDPPVPVAMVESGDSVSITTTIPPGGVVTIPVTYTLTQADIDAGAVENCATIALAGESSPTLPFADEACATLEIEQSPEITVAKTGVANTGENDELNIGESISYEFVVTNTGNVTFHGVKVQDSIPGVIAEDDAIIDQLDPGDSVTIHGSWIVTSADRDRGLVVNCADVSAYTPDQSIISGEQSCSTQVVFSMPNIAVAQVCPANSGGPGKLPGDSVSYTTTIANTGDIAITDIVITTSRAGTFDSPFPTSLEPGQTETRLWTTTVTQADYDAREMTLEIAVTGVTSDGGSTDMASMVMMQAVYGEVSNTFSVTCPLTVAIPEPRPTPPPSPTATAVPSQPQPTAPVVTELPSTGSGNWSSPLVTLGLVAVIGTVVLGLGVRSKQH